MLSDFANVVLWGGAIVFGSLILAAAFSYALVRCRRRGANLPIDHPARDRWMSRQRHRALASAAKRKGDAPTNDKGEER